MRERVREGFSCEDVTKAFGFTIGRRSGQELKFICPQHDDRDPSLSINTAKDAWMCGPCGASGTSWQLVAFLKGLSRDDEPAVNAACADLGLIHRNGNSNGNGTRPKEPSKPRQIIDQFPYPDEAGELLYEVVKYDPKDFRQRRPDGHGGWIWNMQGVRRVPFGLPEVIRAVDVFVAEGEKDARALRKIGLTGTTMVGGTAASVNPAAVADFVAYFKEHQHVTILRDNDQPGEEHRERLLRGFFGRVKSLKSVDLSGLPPKGDVSDWLAGKDAEAAAEELSKITDATPEWTPEDTSKASWELHDLADIEQWKAEPLVWKIENLIPAGGIGFMSGAPKDGKSLLSGDQVLHIAHGRPWLGRFACSPSRILYVAREDPARRLKERLIEINASYGYGPIPKDSVYFLIRERLNLTEPEHIDWLFEQTRKKEFDFIILDVLNRMIPDLDELSAKDMAKMVSIIENLNRELNLTIQMLDHTKKPQGNGTGRDHQTPNPFDLKGSIAKYGAADFMLCLSRTRQAGRLQLYVENKDTDQRPHFFIDVSPKGSDKPKFKYAGDVEQLASDQKALGNANRQKVCDALQTSHCRTSEDIAKEVGLAPATVRNHLSALSKAGIAQRIGETKNSTWKRFAEAIPSILSESNGTV